MKPIPTETATDVGSVGKWVGAAAAGALLMYLLDPERGSARRSRALSALRAAGARTGASVDHALHSAGDRLVDLKDSAASALLRGTDRVQAQAAPVIERARQGAHEATQRLEDSADRVRERARHASDTSRTTARYNSYDSDRYYDDNTSRHAGAGTRGGLSQWLRGKRGARTVEHTTVDAPHPALLGGSLLGVLGLMRRSPGGLLVGLAALALLMQSTRNRTYRVTDNMAMPRIKSSEDQSDTMMVPPGEQAGSRYLH